MSELSTLHDHLERCGSLRGITFRARCVADAFAAFVGARVITTLLIMSLSALAVIQW